MKRYEALPRVFFRDIEADPGYELRLFDFADEIAVETGAWVEYVPAEQLRGAVEALRALHDAAEDYAPPLAATSAHAERWRDAMRRADAIIGGQ